METKTAGPLSLFSSFKVPVVITDLWNKLYTVSTPVKAPNKISSCVCVFEYDPALELTLAHEENQDLKNTISRQEQAMMAVRFLQEWGGTLFFICNIYLFLQQLGASPFVMFFVVLMKKVGSKVKSLFGF
jgi:hypothetical protein